MYKYMYKSYINVIFVFLSVKLVEKILKVSLEIYKKLCRFLTLPSLLDWTDSLQYPHLYDLLASELHNFWLATAPMVDRSV